MKSFNYSARDSVGNLLKGTVEGDNKVEVVSDLRKQGLFVTNIKEEKVKLDFIAGKKGLSKKQVAIFCKQLSFLLSSGVSTLDSLIMLEKSGSDKAYKSCLNDLIKGIQGGKLLSQAMESQKESFSDVVVQQVRAGESGAFIEKVLLDIGGQIEAELSFKSKLKSALVYPIMVVLVMIVMLYFLTTKVVPTITDVLVDSGGELPIITKIVIGYSNFYNKTLIYRVFIFITIFLGYKVLPKIPKTAYKLDKKKLHLKLIGKLLIKISISSFCRTLGSLLNNGVTLVNALDTSKSVMGNLYLKDKIEETKSHVVKDGWELSRALSEIPEFDNTITQLVGIGIEASNLPDVLITISKQLEDEVDESIKKVLSLIEPLLIVVVGVVVAVVVLAMFLPMMSLIDQF